MCNGDVKTHTRTRIIRNKKYVWVKFCFELRYTDCSLFVSVQKRGKSPHRGQLHPSQSCCAERGSHRYGDIYVSMETSINRQCEGEGASHHLEVPRLCCPSGINIRYEEAEGGTLQPRNGRTPDGEGRGGQLGRWNSRSPDQYIW